MSKVVIDARESGTSTGRYVDQLVSYLSRLESEHHFTVLTRADRLEFFQQVAPQFTVIESAYKEFTFAEQLGFKKQLDQLEPDLVHFTITQQPVRYRGKTVTTIQDLTTVRFRNPTKNALVFTFKLQIYKWVIKRVARKSTLIITPSNFVKSDVAHFTGIDPSKITVTYEAADDLAGAVEPITALKDKQFIMFNGRPLPHKNLRRLIEAFAQLQANHPNLYLMLAGKENALHQSYLALASRLGVSDRVVLTGWISDGQLKWAMQQAAAYIYPSLSEGFGLPPLEAMQYGTPVVASKATAIPEVCGEAAHYFDPLDVQAMADAINEVLTDKNLRQDLIAKGKTQAAKYSWQRMAEQTMAVYKQALGE